MLKLALLVFESLSILEASHRNQNYPPFQAIYRLYFEDLIIQIRASIWTSPIRKAIALGNELSATLLNPFMTVELYVF